MQMNRIVVPVVGAVLLAGAWRAGGWQGVALFTGALVFWALLHFNRLMQVMKRAADRPIGSVPSAVMFNAKLRSGVSLLHVVALARSLGALQTPPGLQPESYRWSDDAGSRVTAQFVEGRLRSWALERPAAADASLATEPPPAGRSAP